MPIFCHVLSISFDEDRMGISHISHLVDDNKMLHAWGIYHHPEKIDHLAFNNPPHYEWNHTALFLHFSAFYH